MDAEFCAVSISLLKKDVTILTQQYSFIRLIESPFLLHQSVEKTEVVCPTADTYIKRQYRTRTFFDMCLCLRLTPSSKNVMALHWSQPALTVFGNENGRFCWSHEEAFKVVWKSPSGSQKKMR